MCRRARSMLDSGPWAAGERAILPWGLAYDKGIANRPRAAGTSSVTTARRTIDRDMPRVYSSHQRSRCACIVPGDSTCSFQGEADHDARSRSLLAVAGLHPGAAEPEACSSRDHDISGEQIATGHAASSTSGSSAGFFR